MISHLIGYLAAILTTASFVPQAIKTIRTRNTQGISLIMYIMFSTGVLFWFIYGIVIKDIPVIVANAVTLCFAAIILVYKILYR
ncbi:MAG: SemiSWEET transporter [Bacteroidales bacterium]|nr:SemiSWEET transporter [Bacteroidales bacterium]